MVPERIHDDITPAVCAVPITYATDCLKSQSMLFTLLAFTLSVIRNVPQATRSTVRVGYRVVRAHWN